LSKYTTATTTVINWLIDCCCCKRPQGCVHVGSLYTTHNVHTVNRWSPWGRMRCFVPAEWLVASMHRRAQSDRKNKGSQFRAFPGELVWVCDWLCQGYSRNTVECSHDWGMGEHPPTLVSASAWVRWNYKFRIVCWNILDHLAWDKSVGSSSLDLL
jgi:hypothetical protein